MLGKFGETLVVDWGLAKPYRSAGRQQVEGEETLTLATDNDPAQGTRAGEVAGTPAYMSPEQAKGQLDEMGPASDIFALGATLYTILTGKAPYHDPDALKQAQRGKPPLPRYEVALNDS